MLAEGQNRPVLLLNMGVSACIYVVSCGHNFVMTEMYNTEQCKRRGFINLVHRCVCVYACVCTFLLCHIHRLLMLQKLQRALHICPLDEEGKVWKGGR